jgi:hypothetical protein
MNFIKTAGKVFVFVFGLAVFYGTVVCALSFVNVNGRTLLQRLTGNSVRPGGRGQALLRFRELEDIIDKIQHGDDHVDIVFTGSSHAYRGFDPRLFQARGYSSFNMGSSSQTPLNTYFLLKHYLPEIKPKLIILELYPIVFSTDGYESTLDLLANAPFSWELLEMSWATNNPHAVTNCLQKIFREYPYPLEKFNQRQITDETYIPGGYVETNHIREVKPLKEKHEIELLDSQLRYFAKIIELAKKMDITIVGVIQPLPKDYLRSLSNYQAVVDNLKQVAMKYAVPVFDFNDRVTLDPRLDYKDEHHLNNSGVHKFNQVLIEKLAAIRVLSMTGLPQNRAGNKGLR